MPSLKVGYQSNSHSRGMYASVCAYFLVYLLFTDSLLTRVTSSPLPNVSSQSPNTTTKLYAAGRKFSVSIAAVTCSSASMLSSMVAFYWFARMHKRFRHR
jgi:hypothetical protein